MNPFYLTQGRICFSMFLTVTVLIISVGAFGCVDRKVMRVREDLNAGSSNCGPGVRIAPVWRLSKSATLSDDGTGCDLIITYSGNNCTARLEYDQIGRSAFATNKSLTESLKDIDDVDLTCRRRTDFNACCDFRIEQILCGRPRSIVNINFVDRMDSGASPCGAPPTMIWRAKEDDSGKPIPSHVTVRYEGSRFCAPRLLALTDQGDQINVSGFQATPLTPIVRTFRDVLSILYICIPRQQFIPVEEGEEAPDIEPIPPGEACSWRIIQVESRTR